MASPARRGRSRIAKAPRKRTKYGGFADYVDQLQAQGQYVFTSEDAGRALGISRIAVQTSMRRIAAKGRIITPRRGFAVIVPNEYRKAGTPPPSWFIDDLMKFHEQPYYVGLLSAAALWGAAHQQPQEFQVVTNKALRPCEVGRLRIRFVHKKRLDQTPTADIKTATGTMRASSPEATAFDLVKYASVAGSLDAVATVLGELAEKLDPGKLVEAAQKDVDLSVVQRAGYLIDRIGRADLTEPLAKWLAGRKPELAKLRPDRKTEDAVRDERWHVLVNAEIEVDE
jgi:predicted transcriptional regulator of viral defense system